MNIKIYFRSWVCPILFVYLLGDLVIVKYTRDEDWYRGRVKQVLGKGNVNKMQVEVLYIDFGNSEIVGLDR